MSLILSSELESGVSGNYWRIGSVLVACVQSPIVTVYMELYVNRDAKYNGKTPLITKPVNINLFDIDPTFDYDFRACVYDAMSRTQGWTDSKFLYEFDETYETRPIVNYIEVSCDYNGTFELPDFQGQDINNLPLSFEIVDQPTNGSIVVNNGKFVYTPNSDWSGTDFATYRCFNGNEYSKPAKIYLSVVSAVPVANFVSASSEYNSSSVLNLSATDPFNLPLTFSIVNQPANGTITENNGVFTYAPNSDWYGNDSASYKANNGTYDSNIATILLSVENAVPSAFDVNLTVAMNNESQVLLSATDPKNLSLTYSVFDQPSNGTIIENNGVFTYTPNLDYVGIDSAKYIANNGTYDSNEANINIEVV